MPIWPSNLSLSQPARHKYAKSPASPAFPGESAD
jgi:hypothetical protein